MLRGVKGYEMSGMEVKDGGGGRVVKDEGRGHVFQTSNLWVS